MVKKLITLDGLAVFLSELRKEINAGSGKCFDAEELARRIPSWQWKVTMPKTANQTVTATVGEQTYTDDFYAPQGSKVTFSAKADIGYIAGNLSTVSATLSKDLMVTITAAVESENIEAGEKELEYDGLHTYFEVPPKVRVIKCLWNSIDVYLKVDPGDTLRFEIEQDYEPAKPGFPGLDDPVIEDSYSYLCDEIKVTSKDGSKRRYREAVLPGKSSHMLKVFWSKEINEHAIDHDLTK